MNATPEPSAVQFHQLHKRFAGQPLFQGLDLALPPQCITAVVGASGCGKSTLLQLINGLLRPDAGEVRLFGQPLDYCNLPRLRRRIGYAVQQIGLFPHLTVRDNIAILAEREGWPRSRLRARIEQLLRMMDLAPALLGRYPHEISGGQAQRVGLCRAMMLEPPLLLLDEAFSAVDPITRAEVHARFQALQRAEPRTVVLVTHDVGEAMRLADYLVVMAPGQVLQTGTPQRIRARPADARVARLLESGP
ncbi:MAG: ATP-binding cassette domain-containing protein [Nitrococcus mobilis]|nr:ATP-binding cassette domain-containing protein [Nitrococcus mobilis]